MTRRTMAEFSGLPLVERVAWLVRAEARLIQPQKRSGAVIELG